MISVIAVAGTVFALTGAPAPAATLACGDTVTQDTVVDNDIVCSSPAAIGLVIGADNITIKFKGHSITGVGALGQGSAGITTDLEHSGVTVRDAHIDGFDAGMDLSLTNSEVKGNYIANADSALLLFGDGNYAGRNTVTSAATIGFDVFGNDVYLWGNRIEGKPASGVSVDGENSLVVKNKVLGCSGFDGIAVSGYSTFSKVAQNTVTGCDAGISMSGSGTGAHLQSSDVSGNCDGLFVSDPTAYVWRNNAHDNTCSGITVGSAGATVKENGADNNGSIGIDAVIGTIDGGGNHASGNPDGDCFAVLCVPSF